MAKRYVVEDLNAYKMVILNVSKGTKKGRFVLQNKFNIRRNLALPLTWMHSSN